MNAPTPPSLFAARERAIRLLTDRYAEEVIGEAELDARLVRLNAASDPAGVEAVVGDLVNAAPPTAVATVPDERRILAVMSETKRVGQWVLPRTLRVRALFADVKLDLRGNHIPGGFTVDVFAVAASVTLIVPRGVSVALDVLSIMGSANNQADEVDPATAAPRVRVTGSVFMGEVGVVVRSPGAKQGRK